MLKRYTFSQCKDLGAVTRMLDEALGATAATPRTAADFVPPIYPRGSTVVTVPETTKGGAEWGQITGDIYNQGDLITLINNLLTGGLSLMNDSGAIIETGTLFGSVGSGVTASVSMAVAGTVRAFAVALGTAGIGELIRYATTGVQWVKVDTTVTPTIGQPAYVSAGQAGTATNLRPATGAQLVGQFWDVVEPTTGLAMVTLLPDLNVGRTA